MGNKFQMNYHSVEEGESLPYIPHHPGSMQQSSKHWTQEHPGFCSHLVTGVNSFHSLSISYAPTQDSLWSKSKAFCIFTNTKRHLGIPQCPQANLSENG